MTVCVQAANAARCHVRVRVDLSPSNFTLAFNASLTPAITSPVISALQTASAQINAAGNTGSSRMQALAGANAALNLSQAADALTAGQTVKDANAADKAGGVGISVSLGASSSKATQSSSADTARGSNISAGANVSIQASGAGQASDLTVRGSSIQAAGTTKLKAEDQVNLQAAQNTTLEASKQSSKSASVGIGIQLGAAGAQMGVTVNAAAGKGQGAGTDSRFTNSQVSGQRVELESGGDTNLQGAVVSANQVTANVGGNLNIESLQSTAAYNEKNKSAGGAITFGPAPGGSLSLGRSEVSSDFNSVGEQSAIRAGDGGFQVNVQGNTSLSGGQITSTQAAIDAGANSFNGNTAEGLERLTTTDLQNSASYKASSASVGLSAGAAQSGASLSGGLSGIGIGSDKGSASSVTTAGISGLAGNSAARTGEATTAIKPIFDAEKVKNEIQAQVTITQEFNKQAGQAIDRYVATQRQALQEQANKAATPEDKASTEQAIRDVNMQERALNILVAGLTGMAGSVVTKEALSTAAEKMRDLMIEDSRKFAGVTDGTTTLGNLTGPSDGVRGDGQRIGGTRVDLDLLCGADNRRCITKKNPDGTLRLDLDANGRVLFNPEAAGMSLTVESRIIV